MPRLRGMFAFAIWDTQTRELFLARDPYGIKPLYYIRTKDGLLFASPGQGAAGLGAGFDAARICWLGELLPLGQRVGTVDAVPRCVRTTRRALAAGARWCG